MTPGQLKHRITLQTCAPAGDEFCDNSTEYVDYCQRWAAFRPVSSKELQAGGGKLMQTDVVFTIRFANDLTEIDNTWRVWYQNRRYDVISLVNPGFEDRWLEVRARQYRQNLRVDDVAFHEPLHNMLHHIE